MNIFAQGLVWGRSFWGLGWGSQKKGEKYLLRTGDEASVGVRRHGSELAAGQGSGKNVGLGARGLVLPSLFCVASGESPSLSVRLLPHLKSRAYRLDCRAVDRLNEVKST